MYWSIISPYIFRIVAGLVLFVVGTYLGYTYQKAKTDLVKAQFSGFVEQTKIIGKQAQKNAIEKEKSDQAIKEKVDVENIRISSAIRVDARQLRDARSRGNFVPIKPTGSGSPETACFNRAKLEQAIQRLDDRISGIIERCDDAVVGLDTAKRWSSSLKMSDTISVN